MIAGHTAHRQLRWRRDSPPLRRRSSWLAAGCAAVVWIAIPAVALADDCSAWTLGEVPSCLLLGALLPPFLVAAAILATASWLREPSNPPPLPPLPPLDARPVTPGGGPPDGPPSYPPGYMYDPKTGELWDTSSNRPYPTDPRTGEPYK
jgi:hypothetical protein